MANRTVKFYKNYFLDFFKSQPASVQKKITQILVWISSIDRLPVSIFKTIKTVQGLFEIRIESGGNIFRVFCCFDEGDLVILFNGFQKRLRKLLPTRLRKRPN